ncbi:MAG: YHYH protein [Bacteroidota bacterium]
MTISKFPLSIICLFFLVIACSKDDVVEDTAIACTGDNETSTTNIGCSFTPTEENRYTEEVVNGVRTMTSNGVPVHEYGLRAQLTLAPVGGNYRVAATPTLTDTPTSILRENNRPQFFYGISLHGILLAPAPAEPFIFENPQTGEYNWDWVIEPTMLQGQGTIDMPRVSLDCASAHQGPQGYHYHGNMFVYAEYLIAGISDNSTVPTEPVQMGWAADGFPILYRYGPDGAGGIQLLQSSYQLKEGVRPGDGITAPCDTYSGRYTNDWEYVAGLGDLDECNGIERELTIRTVEGTKTFPYFYVVTDNFPQIGRCLMGTPSDSF